MKNKILSNKLLRITWIIGIYIILIIILLLTIKYKVKFEGQDFSDKLYFYNCSNSLCTTNIKQDTYYSKISCKDNICPYIVEKSGDTVIMNFDNKYQIYDYINDNIISDEYESYSYITPSIFKVKNSNKYGLMDIEKNLIVPIEYDDIKEYINNLVIYKKYNKYGIKSINNDIMIQEEYDDIIYINDKLFAAKKDNKYMIYNYENKLASNNKYNYIYSNNSYIFTFNDKKLDILNKDLQSLLIIKIDTNYDYGNQDQVNTLKFRVEEGNQLKFNIVTSSNTPITYTFDLNNGKLLTN